MIGDILPNSCIIDCSVSSSNRAGGLALLWSNNVNLDIISYNERYIDCYIDSSNPDLCWRASGIYGFSSHQQKPQTCDIIKNLFNNNPYNKWLMFGDFNMVLNHSEKQGGRDINNNHAVLFQETLNDCSLQDLGYHGDIFTWANNQETVHHIKERLDRFCVSAPWLCSFPRVTNYHLPNHTSDHNPILLVFGSHFDSRNDSKNPTIIKRFENIWLQDPQSLQIIKDEWTTSSEDHNTKLQKVFSKVHHWGQDKYGNVPKQIKELQQQIHNMKIKVPDNNDLEQIHLMESNLDNLLKHEETWWAQRAKANWLQQGDMNTRFFHYKSSQYGYSEHFYRLFH
jgi:hypothetical protein